MPDKYTRFKDGLKKFMKQEPVYVWLIIFILVVNILTLIPFSRKEVSDGKMPQKISSAERLVEERLKIEEAIVANPRLARFAAAIIIGVALAIFIGLILDFMIIVRRSGGKELLERSNAPPKIKWSMRDGLKVLILFFFFGYILAIASAFISPLFPSPDVAERVFAIVNATIMDLMGIIVVFYFAVVVYKHKARDLGLTSKKLFKNISYGLLGYLSLLPVLFVTLMITALVLNLFKYHPAPQPVLELFLDEKKVSILIYFSVFVAIAGPVMEEIFFRGFIYSAIRKEIGIGGSIFISAALFSLLHAYFVGFLPIFILGVFLAYLYEKTGSLVPSITVHITHNLIMVFFIFVIKGINI